MAQNSQLYNVATKNLATLKMEWATSYKCALLTSGYTFDKAHENFSDINNEISDASYTAGGKALTIIEPVWNASTKIWTWNAEMLIWSNLTAAEIRQCVIYNSIYNSLVLCQDFGENIALTNETFVIVWPTDGIFNVKS